MLEACRGAREPPRGWFDPWCLPGGVDPTGYVKGWAAQRALDELRGAGLDGAMVNAAGDIASFGAPAPRRGVPRRRARPDAPARARLRRRGPRGARHVGHLRARRAPRQPRHDRRGAAVASASVTGADLGLADALATALCVGGEEVMAVLDAVEGYEGFIIGHDGARHATRHFPFAHRVRVRRLARRRRPVGVEGLSRDPDLGSRTGGRRRARRARDPR